jgi:uncharacterized protein YbaP (TraB family)
MNTTASEQFAQDYLLVIENDQEAWTQAIAKARALNHSMTALSDDLRQGYEVLVDKAIANLEGKASEFGINLMKQILIGWGMSEFDKIARSIIESDL